jgi:hypothetical protein
MGRAAFQTSPASSGTKASGEAGKEPLPADLLLEFREGINAR